MILHDILTGVVAAAVVWLMAKCGWFPHIAIFVTKRGDLDA